MPLTITNRTIRGSDTWHSAQRLRFADGEEVWRVSWLPRQMLDKDRAIAAMRIAEAAGRGVGDASDPVWQEINPWAAQVGVAGEIAVAWAAQPPRTAPPDDIWASGCPACRAGDPHIGWAGDGDQGRSWQCSRCGYGWVAA